MKTDSQLQQDVSAELAWEPAVTAAQIGVSAKGGVVSLTGEVGSYAEKWNAEQAAQRVAGVRALASEMTVRLPQFGTRRDADIARAAENALQWSSAVPQDGVQVMVEDGWLTLSGQLDWRYQKQAAVDAVQFLHGVVGVSNQIAIAPPQGVAPDETVKRDIEAALARSAGADARRVSVQVDGCDVILSGQVRNWSEREAVNTAAWGTPGVRNVVDSLTMVD